MLLELRFAISFLTLLPFAPKKKVSGSVIANSISFFTLTGMLFSFLTVLSIYFYNFHQSPWVLALFIILGHAILSGGLHLDALADTHDGLAVSDRSKAKIQEVIKDSRAGAFAVFSVCLTIIAQLVFIAEANYSSALYLYLLALTPVISRFFLIIEMIFFVNKKELDAKSSLKAFLEANKLRALLLNLSVLVVLIYLYPLTKICILIFLLIALVFSICLYRFLQYKLKGQNGDSMGCGLVLNESFLYFLIFVFSSLAA